MSKKKVTKKQRASFSNKEPEFNEEKYRESLRDVLDWARVYVAPKTYRKWVKDYIGKKDYDQISGATDYELFHVGVLAHLVQDGAELKEQELNHLSTRLERLKGKYKPVKKEKEETGPKVSIQEKMDGLAEQLAGDIDLAMDEFLTEKKWNFDTQAWLTKNQVSPPVAKRVAGLMRLEVKEPAAVLLGKDPEVAKGYDNFTKPQLKNFVSGMLEIIKILDGHVKQRKARVRKTKSPAQIAAKVNYKPEDKDLGISSVRPEKVVEASEVWLYNTKTKKLSVYRETGNKLTVKGTTLIGYDQTKSKSKNIRKPEEFFKELETNGTGKRVISKLFKDLRAKETGVRPRINKDTVILRVF